MPSGKEKSRDESEPISSPPLFSHSFSCREGSTRTAREASTDFDDIGELTAVGVDDWAEELGDGPRQVCWQSLLPLFIGGMGSISAGLILNLAATKLDKIRDTPQFIAVVPPLQAMKGNLDMTFTSRMSTLAHHGSLDEKEGRTMRIFRNIALLQGQAAVLTLFAVLVSFLLDMVKRDPFYCAYEIFIYLAAVGQLAMTVSCFVMTSVMVFIVLFAHKKKLNPDNMATPLASSVGDFLTIGLMLAFCYAIRWAVELHISVAFGIIALVLMVVPLWTWLAWKDEGAREAAKSQWLTLLLATVIASGAGALLEWGEKKYPDMTAYQPLISGIAGNRAALMASRLSSTLNVQQVSTLTLATRLNPFKYYFCTYTKETRTAIMLLFTSVAFQIFFVLISHLIALAINPLHMSLFIILGYLIAAFIQVFFLIFLAQLVSYVLWSKGINPDMHAIPILTAIGDVFGCTLLVILFHSLDAIDPTSVRSAEAVSHQNGTGDGCLSFG